MPPSKRNELVDAAVRVFGREGFHATGVERVLQVAGVSRMTLYNHFKSKDELIVAALRRKDEEMRNRLMRFIDGRGGSARERLLSLFDWLGSWLESDDFHGCAFINAAAEFGDASCAIRRVGAEHLLMVRDYLAGLCAEAGAADSGALAEQIAMVYEGAVVLARMVAQVENNPLTIPGIVRRARDAATTLIDGSTGVRATSA